MRASTAAYDAATQLTDTTVVSAVAFTWPSSITGVPIDLSRSLVSASPSADITTDMPDGTRLITGYPARSCSLVLADQYGTDETITASYLFDPYSTASPLYGVDWTGISGPLVTIWQGLDIATQILAALLPVDPTFESGITGWAAAGTPLPAISSSTTHASVGTKAMLITWAAGLTSQPEAVMFLATVPGVTYDVSVDVYVPASNPAVAIAVDVTGAGSFGAASAVTAAFTTITDRFTATKTLHAIAITPGAVPTAGQQVWVDNLIVTQSAEMFVQFTGYVDDCSIDRTSNEVTLTLRDPRGLLETTPNISTAVSSLPGNPAIMPGLTNEWIVDQVLRSNGIYTSPPVRSLARYFMSGHGSLWPEVGTVPIDGQLQSSNVGQGPYIAATFATNRFGSARCALAPVVAATLTSPLNLHTGSAYIEGYADFSSLPAGTTAIAIIVTDVSTATATALPAAILSQGDSISVSAFWDAANTRVSVSGSITRNILASGTVTGHNATGSTQGWAKIGALFTALNTTGGTVSVFVDDVLVAGPTVISSLAASPNPFIPTVSIQGGGSIENVQVTSAATAPVATPFTPGAFLDASLNNLLATPPIDSSMDSWGVIQQAAESEFAVAGFDESAIFRYRNRKNVPSVPSSTITSTTRLTSLTMETNEANRARSVTCTAAPLGVAPETVVWSASAVVTVPPLSTVTVFAQLDSPAMFVPGVFAIIPNNAVSVTVNGIRLSSAPDGSGAVPPLASITASALQLSGQTVLITITSNVPYPVYIASPAIDTDVAAGTAVMQLVGRLVKPLNAAGVVITDTSVPSTITLTSTYASGAPVIALPDNAFRQDVIAAQSLLDDTLADLVRPRPMLPSVTIIGDARLQLGDRVQLQDLGDRVDDGFGAGALFAEDVIITSIHPSLDASSGFTQECVCRTMASPRQWVLGRSGRSEIGVTTWI